MSWFVACSVLAIFSVSHFPLQCKCSRETKVCDSKYWDIDLSGSMEGGEADMLINVPDLGKGPRVTTILACQGLSVNGTEMKSINLNQSKETVNMWHLSIPKAKEFEEKGRAKKSQNYTCVLQLTYHSSGGERKGELECEIQVKAVEGRILPKCSLERGLSLLEKVEVKHKLGGLFLYFKHSANDLFTHNSSCDSQSIETHNYTQEMMQNLIILPLPNSHSVIHAVDFYPDCDNETIRKFYSEKGAENCHMELYMLCQEGLQLVKKMELDFNESAMICNPPKSYIVLALQQLELVFFIENKPVVALLVLLLLNLLPYTILIPVLAIQIVISLYRDQSDVKQEEEEAAMLSKKTHSKRLDVDKVRSSTTKSRINPHSLPFPHSPPSRPIPLLPPPPAPSFPSHPPLSTSQPLPLPHSPHQPSSFPPHPPPRPSTSQIPPPHSPHTPPTPPPRPSTSQIPPPHSSHIPPPPPPPPPPLPPPPL